MSSLTHRPPLQQAYSAADRTKKRQARITEMFKNIQPEVELHDEEANSFHEEQRQRGCWGQDRGGLYFMHADGRKQYKHLSQG